MTDAAKSKKERSGTDCQQLGTLSLKIYFRPETITAFREKRPTVASNRTKRKVSFLFGYVSSIAFRSVPFPSVGKGTSCMQEEHYSLDGVEDEIRDVLKHLLSSEVRRRPTVGQLLDEPLCWNGERRLKFLLDVAAGRNHYLQDANGSDGSRLRAELRTDAGHAGRLMALDIPPALVNKVEFLIGERFYPSIMNILLTLKFYMEERQTPAKASLTTATNSWNSDTSSSSIFSPKDEYKFWIRYAPLFWDVLRIAKSHPEYWKVIKLVDILGFGRVLFI
uniref:Uncharacterized protein n=1 Tax=Romanomermis culicivorax TaxID=13658 RepID=A0A915KG69_ROMCU